jgi:hypothetical protein
VLDLKSLFLVENGLSFDDDVVILSGSTDPSLIGQTAPVGSLYIRNNGQLWQKFDANDVDWQLVSAEGTSVKVSSTDTTTGFLNDKLTVSSSLLKAVVPSVPGPQTLQLDLSPTGVSAGTYTKVTVDAKGRVVSANNPTTLLGYGITDAQPLHPNLTALANISAGSPPVGLYTVTGTGTSVARAITGTSNQISVDRGDGIGGNPQVSISDDAIFPGTKGITVPIGTQAQEVASDDGTLRYDSTLNKFRFRQNGQWLNFGHDLVLYLENPVSPAASTASGQNAVAIGEGGIASGQNSIVLGTSKAQAPQSTAIGNGARAASYGQVAFSARPISSLGSSQGGEYVYAGQTIAQFPIELFLDGVSERATFPDADTAVTFTALIIAQRVDVKGEMYSAKIDGQLYKGSTNADTTVTTVKSQWGVTHQDMDSMILADTTNGTFNVKVKGKAGQTWRWTIRVSTAENIL